MRGHDISIVRRVAKDCKSAGPDQTSTITTAIALLQRMDQHALSHRSTRANSISRNVPTHGVSWPVVLKRRTKSLPLNMYLTERLLGTWRSIVGNVCLSDTYSLRSLHDALRSYPNRTCWTNVIDSTTSMPLQETYASYFMVERAGL